MVSGNLRLLLLENGKADEIELGAAWDKILLEYSQITMTDSGSTIFETHKAWLYTKWKITYVAYAAMLLKREYREEVAQRLTELGFDKIEPKENRDEYLRQVYTMETEAKFLVVQLNQYTVELEKLMPQGSEEGDRLPKSTLQDYDRELAYVQKYMGFRIKKPKISLAEYGSYVRLIMDSKKKK